MKTRAIAYFILLNFTSNAQIVYFEDFGTGCSTGTNAVGYNGWTQTITGAEEALANQWYISAAENNEGIGNCGAGCGSNRTLHVSTNTGYAGDLGAAYFETSAFFCSFLGLCSRTNRRIESPTINCTPLNPVPLQFEYMENGESTFDNATLWYSANNGATWSLLVDLAKTTVCASGQGQWTVFNTFLPASANNNPNVKIAFRWENNANGVGTDPSFAVDNITVGTVVLSQELTTYRIVCDDEKPALVWRPSNHDLYTSYELYVSSDGIDFALKETFHGAEINENQNFYREPLNERTDKYVYLKCMDNSGVAYKHPILHADCQNYSNNDMVTIFPNPLKNDFSILCPWPYEKMKLITNTGQTIQEWDQTASNTYNLSSNISAGIYFIEVIGEKKQIIRVQKY